MKKVRDGINERKNRNQAWYDRRSHEDATQRADAQAILQRTEDAIKARNKAAAGAAAVMGGTEESVAATKAANAQAIADATSQIAVNGERQKDLVEQQYLERDAKLDSELDQMEVRKASAIADAVKGVSQAGAGLAESLN